MGPLTCLYPGSHHLSMAVGHLKQFIHICFILEYIKVLKELLLLNIICSYAVCCIGFCCLLGRFLLSNLQPLTTICKTHPSIIRTAQSPVSPAKVARRTAVWWDCGTTDMLTVHTAHFLPLYASPSCQDTLSVGHPSSCRGRRPPTLNAHLTSITQEQANPLLMFGSIRKCAALLDKMSDDSATAHLDSDGVNLLNRQEEASACAVLY